MKEKQKGKINPFAPVLQHGETLLWSHTPRPVTFGAHFLRYIMLSFVGITIISFLLAIVVALSPRYNPQPWYVILVSYTVVNLVWLTPLAGTLFLLIYPVFWIQNRRSGNTAYALTSERLLTWTRGRITETHLQQVQTIIRPSRDRLSFGKAHPAWRGIKEPKSVATLIQAAKTARET